MLPGLIIYQHGLSSEHTGGYNVEVGLADSMSGTFVVKIMRVIYGIKGLWGAKAG